MKRVVVVEAQTSLDRDKLFTWPLHQALARARHRVACDVVVVTLDGAIADWARHDVVLGMRSTFRPIVVGPAELRNALESSVGDLAFFAAVANLRQETSLVRRAVEALLAIPESKRELYFQVLARTVADTTAHAALESAMEKEPFLSDYSKRLIEKRAEEALERGRAEAVAALRKSVLTVLEKRGMAIAPGDMPRVETCTDVTMLTKWLERALSAAKASDVFD